MIVLATIEEGRPLPRGVTVLAHVRATGRDWGRHAVDLGSLVSHDGSMLLTVAEAADELRLTPRQIQRYVKSGALPSIVLGSARRIDRDDLAAFVAEHRHGGNGSTPTPPAYHRNGSPTVSTVAGRSQVEIPETNEPRGAA